MVATLTNKGIKHLVEIETADGKITATQQHPFWLPQEKRWADAKDLQIGSVLQTSASTWVRVTAIKKRAAVTRVHNLTIDDIHTYHVQAADVAILVHNTGGCSHEKLYHYTNESGMNAIVESGVLNPSLKSVKPKDARLGDGQYLSDIAPGTKSCGQLARCFLGVPWGGQRFTHYVEIDVRGLNLVTDPARPGVFLVPGQAPLKS